MLQLLYLKFTNISKDEKSYQNLISQLEVSLKNRSLSPETALSDSLNATLYGHNPRLEPMTLEALKDVDYDRMLEIMRERTASARDWTFYLVGNRCPPRVSRRRLCALLISRRERSATSSPASRRLRSVMPI